MLHVILKAIKTLGEESPPSEEMDILVGWGVFSTVLKKFKDYLVEDFPNQNEPLGYHDGNTLFQNQPYLIINNQKHDTSIYSLVCYRTQSNYVY